MTMEHHKQVESLPNAARAAEALYNGMYLERNSSRAETQNVRRAVETNANTMKKLQEELNLVSEGYRSLQVEHEEMTLRARNLEESIQDGVATQCGGVLLLPLEPPAWLHNNYTMKGPLIFHALDAPKTPKGQKTVWDTKYITWTAHPRASSHSQTNLSQTIRTNGPL